jgi:membrane protease YdiL (CAAX protease family)
MSIASERAGFWKGPDGLRTGWAILLFMTIFVVAATILFLLMYVLMHLTLADIQALNTRIVPAVQGSLFFAECAGLLVAYGVMSRIDRRPWRDHGLGGARAGGRFAQGALTGALLMSLLVGVLVLAQAMKTSPSGTPAPLLIESGLQWAVMFLAGAFVEEMMFRGYPFFRLTRAIGPTRAAIVMSLAFGLAHLPNGGEALLGILQVIAIGLLFCLAVWRTGSLWWAIGAHAAWNWAQTFVFGCSNSGLAGSGQWLVSVPTGPVWLSGGSTGPEGSLLVMPILALMAAVIMLTLPFEPRSRPETALSSSP